MRSRTVFAGVMFGGVAFGVLGACAEVVSLDKYKIVQSGEGLGDGGTTDVETAPCTVVTPSQDAVRACVMSLGCSPYVPNQALGDCITYDQTAVTSGKGSCLKTATSCAAVLACQGYAVATSAQCPSNAATVRCSGNTAIECSSRIKSAIDCNVLGGVCETYRSSGTGTPDRAGCRVQTACSGTASSCSGSVAFECRGGKGYGQDCAKSNATCSVREDAGTCFSKGPSCKVGSPVTCNGDTAELCDVGGRLDFDCSKSGLGCVLADDTAYCLAPGCTPAGAKECKESCTGLLLNVCVGGVKTQVDCRKFGFTQCIEGDFEGLHYALCRP